MGKEVKTNAMRILDREKICYEHSEYECKEFVDGIQCADALGLDHKLVYKTLVTTAGPSSFFVFVIPIEAELDLKAAAKSVGVKSLAMIHVKDITAITGYVRGGCTAIGMKKQYVTRVDASAQSLEKIYVSAGRIGAQICLAPGDLVKVTRGEYAEITF